MQLPNLIDIDSWFQYYYDEDDDYLESRQGTLDDVEDYPDYLYDDEYFKDEVRLNLVL